MMTKEQQVEFMENCQDCNEKARCQVDAGPVFPLELSRTVARKNLEQK